MLTYEADATPAHRLDARSKLLFQIGFAVAVFGQDSWPALAALALVAVLALASARCSPRALVRSFRFVLLVVALAPVVATLNLGPPWIVPERAVDSALAGYRVVLVLFVSGAIVRSTPVRETRAAIQRHVPGRPGQLLGVGTGLVFRFFPVLARDIDTARLAIRARAGEDLSTIDRVGRLTIVGLRRAFARADRLSLALRARCFAWNPTLPALRFRWRDLPVVVVAVALAVSPLLL